MTEHGWDGEDSEAVFVCAMDEAAAHEWGRELAEALVKYHFDQAGWPDPPSWKASEFAHWIEDDLSVAAEFDRLGTTPTVAVGEYPNIAQWAASR